MTDYSRMDFVMIDFFKNNIKCFSKFMLAKFITFGLGQLIFLRNWIKTYIFITDENCPCGHRNNALDNALETQLIFIVIENH